MMVTFVSQCQKKALNRTRRVLDAFADRIGDNTWQTVITQEGLLAVKKLLRKTASKNTAVSCHWIRSRSRSDLMWVVGSRDQFNQVGVVPVNSTSNSLQAIESFALNTNVIALAASLAGYFHDIGKANGLFQAKLKGKGDKKFEPYRHEWVSLRLFQAFVNERDDKGWLNELVNIDNNAETNVLKNLDKLKDGKNQDIDNPFKCFPPLAKLVAWLIVSHHKLPASPAESDNAPDFNNIEYWRDCIFNSSWNSPQCLDPEWTSSVIKSNWEFPNGTPFLSVLWQNNVSRIAKKILHHERTYAQCWLDQKFTAHLARLCLMLADHYYSSDNPNPKVTEQWQDRNYPAIANTYRDDSGRQMPKQKLDEHNIAVGEYAQKIATALPFLRHELPALSINKKLIQSTKKEGFEWQNEAYVLAKSVSKQTQTTGFFGICMASTGKGKTLANARIMYGLSGEDTCRFSVALGLRTLTVQTADALQTDLQTKPDEVAMLVGSQAVKDLYGNNHKTKDGNSLISQQEASGSESSNALIDNNMQVSDHLPDYFGEFSEWIDHDPKIMKLLQAPILISTIDYLIPANEGIRGGKQIAPMLRLLTSDLVLDEPDDFNLSDLPALCRLVNWAGMLGSRVLLSTATMPPTLAEALFCAYQEGREHYTEVNGEQGKNSTITCAWFDEFKKHQTSKITDVGSFKSAHQGFINQRVKQLSINTQPLRQAKLIDITSNKKNYRLPSQCMAYNIFQSITKLHNAHAIDVDDKRVSIGLVRMANIAPLVGVTKCLIKIKPPENTIIHYCIYHGQFALLQRSAIEHQLDKALNRKDKTQWLKCSGIPEMIRPYAEKNHIFVVIATSVAEVGRDHDYDWAVIEPSSMRSIIQLAGRIQRHRKQVPSSENIHLLSINYKGLKNEKIVFKNPGFETHKIQCASHNLFDLDINNDLSHVNAIPRIQIPSDRDVSDNLDKSHSNAAYQVSSFTILEYLSQVLRLFPTKTENDCAALWWQNPISWCGELQRRQRFRKSEPNQDYFIQKPEHGNGYRWSEKLPNTYPAKIEVTEDIKEREEKIVLSDKVTFWAAVDIVKEIQFLQQTTNTNENQLLEKYTQVSLRKSNNSTDEKWLWHSHLGIYSRLTKDRWS